MELLNEEEQAKEGKGRKIIIGSIIGMIILIILLAILILILKQAENDRTKLNVDGKTVSIGNDFMISDQATGNSYFSIIQVARATGYNYFNGEYKKYSEDKNKCYVECKEELAMFELNSNKLYKNNAPDKLNFDLYMLDKPVVGYNNALYASKEAIQTAFNVKLNYDNSNSTISIYTLSYMIDHYKAQAEKMRIYRN